ncbi:MAG: polyphosphate polymerase domain-containing protein [Bacteroidaceae bacterium]|nr:polyphosphate polymerase domain-containing protein [Bacteroidaceae bacterium]
MAELDQEISSLLSSMQMITLDEMSGIRLMNRLDTKYVASKKQLIALLHLVQDKYYVQETLGNRIIPYCTTYFDTVDHKMYLMHHNKRAARCKVRVRTYVASNLTFLEVKNKNNHGRTKKKRIEVDSLDNFRETEGASELVERKTHIRLNDLNAVVQNNFERVTLVNYDKTERLTIDFNIKFKNFETGLDHDTDQLVVIELKRDGNVYSPIINLLRDIHVPVSGFSKCCIGMALTDPSLKRNNFKIRLRNIERINGRKFIKIAI